jgi:hypothetical protein
MAAYDPDRGETDSPWTLEKHAMPDERELLPPIPEITERLTVIAREQQRLRKLLSLAVQAKDDAEKFGRPDEAPADRKAVTT